MEVVAVSDCSYSAVLALLISSSSICPRGIKAFVLQISPVNSECFMVHSTGYWTLIRIWTQVYGSLGVNNV